MPVTDLGQVTGQFWLRTAGVCQGRLELSLQTGAHRRAVRTLGVTSEARQLGPTPVPASQECGREVEPESGVAGTLSSPICGVCISGDKLYSRAALP